MILSGIYALWRFRNPPGPSPSIPARSSDMQVAEARALLGLGENSSVEDTRAAHRRLISLMHPDRGGTEALAQKINAARHVLLRHYDEKEMPGSRSEEHTSELQSLMRISSADFCMKKNKTATNP